jgi:hypothetical protein
MLAKWLRRFASGSELTALYGIWELQRRNFVFHHNYSSYQK